MNKKAAIELSANIIVVIIISIVIVGLGLGIFFKSVGQLSEFKDNVDEQTKEQLFQTLAQGQRIAKIPATTAIADNGKGTTIAIGIRNELITNADQNFRLVIIENAFISPEGNTGTFGTDLEWDVQYDANPFTIAKNDKQAKKVVINVPKEAPDGEYIFNAYVCVDDNATNENCPEGYNYYGLTKLYVKNP